MDRARALKYFQSTNQARLERLRQLAPNSQQAFYALLAFLFHANHKLLPGYVSDEVPVGIMDYRPDSVALNAAVSLHKTFNYKHKTLRRYAIRGLYLTNAQGWFNYPSPCRLSLWVVHTGRLAADQHDLLKQKADTVAAWAANLGITLDVQLYAESDFNTPAGPSAAALDLFYSSGIVMAGSVPLWWLTSTEQDSVHDATTDQQINQRVFTEFSFLSFALPGNINSSDCFVQTEQALLAVLQQGLVQLPDLLFQLQQLEDFPACTLLSSRVKVVMQETEDPLAIDPLMLKYQLIATRHPEHLDILQSAIYQKARESLSKSVQKPAHPWRRSFMQTLCQQWQWSKTRIEAEDQRMQGQHLQQMADWQDCLDFLKTGLNQLQQFVIRQNLAVSGRVQALSRMLNTWTHQVSGCLPVLPPLQQAAQAEEQLSFVRAATAGSAWRLESSIAGETLFRSHNLLEVLAWAIVNKVLDRSSLLRVNDGQHQFNAEQLKPLCQRLLRSPLSQGSQWSSSEQLSAKAEIDQLWLFSNFGQLAHDSLSEQGLKVSSRQDDPLSYSSKQVSLVGRHELLIRASDGQWHYQLFEGADSTNDMLAAILRWSPQRFHAASLSTECMTELYGSQIAERMQQLTRHCIEHYQRFPDHGRYLFPHHDRLVQLQWQPGDVDALVLPVETTAAGWLAKTHDEFTASAVDIRLDPQGLYRLLSNAQSSGQISCFLRLAQSEELIVHLIDENGCLLTQHYRHLSESAVLHQLQATLSRIKETNALQRIRFYRLQYRQQWQIEVLAPPGSSRDYLPVQAALSANSKTAQVNFHCGETLFSGQADDPVLYQDIQQWLSHRSSRLPLQITRISITDEQHHPGSEYLRHKFHLEHLLNSVNLA